MESNKIVLNPKAVSVMCSNSKMSVELADGRIITVPLEWFPRLLRASESQRQDYQLLDDGSIIHWESVDEDISVSALLSKDQLIVLPDGSLDLV